MWKWFSGSATPRGEASPASEAPGLDLETLRQQDTAVVFKHSRSCSVRWMAQREVRDFAQQHPSVPVYTITVQQDRELSRHIEQWTGIRHQSPQVIIFRRGTPVASASHGEVTADYLSSAVA